MLPENFVRTICRLFALCLFLIIASFQSFTQLVSPASSDLNVRSLTVNNGLPQGQVRGMVQDKQGFIWIATMGLSRYDGRAFLHYRPGFGNPFSIANDDIRDLQIDDGNNLWIVYGSKEVDVMNAFTGHIRHISEEPAFQWLNNWAPSTLTIRQVASRYFAVNSDGILTFDTATGNKEPVLLPPNEKVLALGGNIKEKILVSTTKALYELKGNRLQRLLNFPAFSTEIYRNWDQFANESKSIGRILGYRNGNMIITVVGGIYTYNKQKNSCDYFGTPMYSIMPYSSVIAADGNIYVNLKEGIYRVTDTLSRKLVFKNGDKLLFNEFLLADRSGLLWASSGVSGIRMFDLHPVNFHSYTYKTGFGSDVLQPLVQNQSKEKIYLSYDIRSAKDANSNIWALYRTTKVLNEKKTEKNYVSKLGSMTVSAGFADTTNIPHYITFDGNNQCWMMNYNRRKNDWELVNVNLYKGTTIPFASIHDKWFENGYLTAIADKICFVSEDVLRLYDTVTKACIIYSKDKIGVSSILLMAIADPKDKQILWIATKGSGMVKLNIKTGETVHFDETNGLPDNTVYFIAADKKGFFWCSSNKGIFRFNPADGSVTSFTVKDGLQGNEFNRYHFLETPDGHFIFGGTEGYTVFHPDSILIDNYQPPVIISDIQVNNLPLQQVVPELNSAVSSLDRITLAHDQNFLSLSFSGLQYNAPEKLQYRYMLLGIDKSWVYAGGDASAKYANIPPGHYTFKVNASNTGGNWSNKVKILEITVMPPWWKTILAYSFYIIALATTLYILYRNWLHRVRTSQQIILKQREAEQAHAMEEMKSHFFANITHELRTPLTLIMSPVQKQLQENAATYSPALLKGVYQNSKQLLRLINQLLDVSKLEAGNMPVTLSRGDITLFIESLLNAFNYQAETRNIHLSYQHAGTTIEYLFDSDKLEKIMYNLLSNAFKFTHDNGSVTVALSLMEEKNGKHAAQITVTDTGTGIPAEHLPHIFDRFYQANTSSTRKYEGTGIGLSLVKELTTLMGGEIKAESTVGKGSVFTLTLLLQAADNDANIPLVEYAVVKEIPADEPEKVAETQVTREDKPVILVTEDNTQLRSFIKESLSPHYKVITVANGEEGLNAAVNELPDLIISDVMMPVMDGYEFCHKAKENPVTSHIGFILLTAKIADESRMGGLRSGADHYLSKPFIVEELLLVISNLLKRQQKLREFYSKQLQPGEKLLQVNEIEDEFLRSVYAIIENNLDSDKLDVEFLATELAVSRRTLNRKLSAVADTSANEIIRHYRLKKAAGLLLAGQGVSETAYATGFSTPSYFSQCFKEMYGQSPVQWVENGEMSQN